MAAETSPRPSQHDDIDHGYHLNDLWNADGEIYAAQDTASGSAQWCHHPQCKTTLPGDFDTQTGLRPSACWALFKLRRDYTGPCIRILRVSDMAERDIGFDHDDFLDLSALDDFLNGQEGRVCRLYDQGTHCLDVVRSEDHGPTIRSSNRIGRSPSLIFDSEISGAADNGAHRTYSRRVSMNFPVGMSLDSRNMSVIVCARAHSHVHPSAFFTINKDGSEKPAISLVGQYQTPSSNAGFSGYFHEEGTLCPSMAPMLSTPFIAGLSSGPGGCFTFVGHKWHTTISPDIGTLGGEGGSLGAAGSGVNGYCEIAAVIVYPSYLTGHDIINVAGSMSSKLQLSPQARVNIVADGDSLTAGDGSKLHQNWTRQLEPLLNFHFHLVNTGESGDVLYHRNVFFMRNIAPLYETTANSNINVISAGSNDIVTGASADSLFHSLLEYCAQSQAVGFKVGIATILPRRDILSDDSRTRVLHEFNRKIRSLWDTKRSNGGLGADFLIDIAAEPIMGSLDYPSNRTVCADGIHPTSAGYGRLAVVYANAINVFAVKEGVQNR